MNDNTIIFATIISILQLSTAIISFRTARLNINKIKEKKVEKIISTDTISNAMRRYLLYGSSFTNLVSIISLMFLTKDAVLGIHLSLYNKIGGILTMIYLTLSPFITYGLSRRTESSSVKL